MSKTNSLHYQLCCLGAKWMRRLKYSNYKYVAVELVCTSAENPDVWGTNGFESMIIEVKTSKADFIKDRLKFIRNPQNKRFAMGNYRYYLMPSGLVPIENIPENWGLLEWDGKQITLRKSAPFQECENRCELSLLCSIMRREGIKSQIFNCRKTK